MEEANNSTDAPAKRRRRRKHFPEMIPTSRVRVSARPSPVLYDEALMDRIVEMQINGTRDVPAPKRRRGRPPSSASSSSLPSPSPLALHALIALSVGFPPDSLSEEEIVANVIPTVGSSALQPPYLAARNRLLADWRSSPSVFLHPPPPDAPPPLRAAHAFLHRHGYINFGLAPAIRRAAHPPAPAYAPTVLVVGAGLAALSASRHLLSLGARVLLLEGRLRPGGRVLTRRLRSPDAPSGVSAAADLGGSVLTGINGNPFGVLARQLGLPLHKVRDECPLYLPDGRAADPAGDARVEAEFNQLLEKVCKLRQSMMEEMRGVDLPLGTALEAFRHAYGVAAASLEDRMLLDWHLANLEYANATSLSNLSMAHWDQDDPYEMGGDHCFIPGGNARFVRALTEDLPILYGKTVTRIHYGSDGVLVHAGGQLFRGDAVLCTVPLGVLKKGSIEFVPELPVEKQEAIQRLGFGLLNKVAMLFPYDFWGGSIDTFGHLTEDPEDRGEFFLFYSYSSVSGGPLLIALVAGQAAIKFEKVSPAEPVERVLAVLRGIFAPKGILVPDPLQVVCTRWGADKFAYGSYSYVAVGSSGDDYDILAESVGDGRVFFAGEATNRRYPATMHGAFLSGLREAAKIFRVFERKTNVSNEAIEEKNVIAVDLDDLFRSPDLALGNFLVLFDPSSSEPNSYTLIRVPVGNNRTGSGSLFLYGLFQRKHVMELQKLDGDESRVNALYQNYGTMLVVRKDLGSSGEALAERIKAARSGDANNNDEGLIGGG